jgi:hypothetical protein
VCSETSAYKIQTSENCPKDRTEQSFHVFCKGVLC